MPTDPDAPGNEPNLELPSFGFGRKKKRGRKTGASEAPTTEVESVDRDEPDEPDEPTATTTPATQPAAPAAPAAPRTAAAPPAPPRAPSATPSATPATGPTPARPPSRPAARPAARPATSAPTPPSATEAPTTAAAPASPARPPAARPPAATPLAATPPVPEGAPLPVPPVPFPAEPAAGTGPGAPDVEQTLVDPIDPLDQAAAAMDASEEAKARRRAHRDQARSRRRAEKAERKRASSRDRLAPRLPVINPLVAAILTGAVCGLATVLLAFGAARGCDAVRGAESCGGGAGLLAVVAILVIEILIGANLLKAFRISDPFSTSFLGVGLVATLAMLFFLDQINSPWMLLVIPLMTAAAFALSWWVTVRVVDEHPMSSEIDGERGEPAFRGDRSVDEAQEHDSHA